MPSVNNIATNKRTELVMLQFLVNAPYLTVGSKKYFSDQLVDKRNGQVYEFVIRDRGVVNHGLNQAAANPTFYAFADGTTATKTEYTAKGIKQRKALVEQRVMMSLEDFNISVSTNAIEKFTDLNWEAEVGKPQGGSLAQDVTRTYVTRNFPKAATAIIGSGFQPLAEAGAHLEDISSEKVFGFVDSKIQAILTSNGQQFNPVGSPSQFYAKGLLGTFHDVEYRSQRFFPKLKIASADKSTLEGATAATLAFVPASGDTPGYHTLTLTNASVAVKAGTPIAIVDKDGESIFVACDLLGDATNSPFYFIAAEDAAAGEAIKIANLPYQSYTMSGTRVFASYKKVDNNDGFADVSAVNTAIAAAIAADGKVTTPLEGNKAYFCGQLRLDGAMEFETLNKFDASNAETKAGDVLGFMMFENRVVDIDEMINDTRWDVVAMAGIVDPRACVNIYTTAS